MFFLNFHKIRLLFNTVKFLKITQILYRIKRKLIKPSANLTVAPKASDIKKKVSESCAVSTEDA